MEDNLIDGLAHYPLALLQEVLDRLWNSAEDEDDGFVLKVHSKVLESGEDIPLPDNLTSKNKRKTTRVTHHHMSEIFEVLKALGVITVHQFEASQYTYAVARVRQRRIDPEKYSQLYSGSIEALQARARELEVQLQGLPYDETS